MEGKNFGDNRFKRNVDIMGVKEGFEYVAGMREEGRGMADINPSNLEPKLKNKIAANALPNFTVLEAMLARYRSSGDHLAEGSVCADMYKAVCAAGSGRVDAEVPPTIAGLTSAQLAAHGTPRRGHFYTAMCELGDFFFPHAPVKLFRNRVFTCQPVFRLFGAIGAKTNPTIGSFQYFVECEVKLLGDELSNAGRKDIRWSVDTSTDKQVYNPKFHEIMNCSTTKIEDLMTALGFPRIARDEVTQDVMDTIRAYATCEHAGNVDVRYVNLYLPYLLMILHQESDLSTGSFPTMNITHKAYTPSNMRDIIMSCGNQGSATVVDCRRMTPEEAWVMCSSVAGYKKDYYRVARSGLHLGGFDVPSEVDLDRGTIYAFGVDNVVRPTTITRSLVYATMQKYAINRKCNESMSRGLCYAATLVMSDGLQNFSLPKPQGYLDVISAALVASSDQLYIPPATFSVSLLTGALTVTRQALLCCHDIINHARAPVSAGSPPRRITDKVRQHIYAMFSHERFTQAFEIMGVIDPLHIQTEAEETAIAKIVLPVLIWSATSNQSVLPYSQSAYYTSGYWISSTDREFATKESEKMFNRTAAANALSDIIGYHRAEGVQYALNALRAGTVYIPTGPCSTLWSHITYKVYSPKKADVAAMEPVEYAANDYDSVTDSHLDLPDEVESEEEGDHTLAMHAKGPSPDMQDRAVPALDGGGAVAPPAKKQHTRGARNKPPKPAAYKPPGMQPPSKHDWRNTPDKKRKTTMAARYSEELVHSHDRILEGLAPAEAPDRVVRLVESLPGGGEVQCFLRQSMGVGGTDISQNGHWRCMVESVISNPRQYNCYGWGRLLAKIGDSYHRAVRFALRRYGYIPPVVSLTAYPGWSHFNAHCREVLQLAADLDIKITVGGVPLDRYVPPKKEVTPTEDDTMLIEMLDYIVSIKTDEKKYYLDKYSMDALVPPMTPVEQGYIDELLAAADQTLNLMVRASPRGLWLWPTYFIPR